MEGWQTTESIIYTVIVSKSKNFGLYFGPSLAVKVHHVYFSSKVMDNCDLANSEVLHYTGLQLSHWQRN